MSGSNVIVDRKDNVLELYKDFTGSQNRGSYENAALFTQVAGKQLVYVIGTDPDNHVEQISDLNHWRCIIKNQIFLEPTYTNRSCGIKPCIHMSALFLLKGKSSVRQFGI